MNNASKTQNRILIVTVALILTFAAVMILLTVTQRRKDPLDTKQSGDSVSSTSGAHTETTPADKPHLLPEDETLPALPKDSDSAAVTEEELTPVNAEENVLPDFISPVVGASSKSYSIDVPVFSMTMNDYRAHAGVDIAASLGTPVRAVAEGTIQEVWTDPMMGTCLSIEHSGGARSIYRNLAPELPQNVTVGASVRAGETIGAVGESALIELAESSHLHYELEIDGASVNPADFMLIGSEDVAYEG